MDWPDASTLSPDTLADAQELGEQAGDAAGRDPVPLVAAFESGKAACYGRALVSALAARIPSRDRMGSFLSWRRLPVLIALGVVVFALVYVLFLSTIPDANGHTSWRTTNFGSAVHDPSSFLKIVLDSLTFAAALFIVASGFALIFGLMRVVNMAHGGFYLLAGYIAYEVQQGMTGQGFSLQSSEVNTWEWLVPLLVAAPCIAVIGLRRCSRRSCAGTRARSCARR